MKKTFLFKTDLAQAYFPHIDPHSARHKLMSLIHSSTSLLNQLQETGYDERQRQLSPMQVEIITSHFGSPFN